MSAFDLYFDNSFAGKLHIDSGSRMQFIYDKAYVASGMSAISSALPTSTIVHEDEVVFPFIENLLPEGEVRTLIQQHTKITTGDVRALVSLLGGDVAGAISIQLEGNKPQLDSNVELRPLNTSELSKLLLDIQDRPFNIPQLHSEVGNRLSLAGAQNKLPVVIQNDRVYEALNTPSTHIIKPSRKDGRFPSLVYNEYVCMKAAKRCGIDTAEVSLIDVMDHNGNESDALVIERYDRVVGKSVKRLHQEDLCQLSSVPSALKYEANGGPGFDVLFKNISVLCRVPVKGDLEVFRRMMFNLAAGNYDAHGKNFSLLYHADSTVSLSPAYDLVCTALYSDLDQRFAMRIGNADSLSELNCAEFRALFDQVGKKFNAVQKQLIRFAGDALFALSQEIELFANGEYFAADVKQAQTMRRIIEKNHTAIIKALAVDSTRN